MSLFTITVLILAACYIAMFLATAMVVLPYAPLAGQTPREMFAEMWSSVVPLTIIPIVLVVVSEVFFRGFKKFRTADDRVKAYVAKRQIAGQLGLAYLLILNVVEYDTKGIVLLLFMIAMGCAVLFRRRMKMGYPFWYVNVCCAWVVGGSWVIALPLQNGFSLGIGTIEMIGALKIVAACTIFGVGSHLNYRHTLKQQTFSV